MRKNVRRRDRRAGSRVLGEAIPGARARAETIPDTDSQTEEWGCGEQRHGSGRHRSREYRGRRELRRSWGPVRAAGLPRKAGDSADGESSAEAGDSAGGESSAEAGDSANSGTAADAEESGAPEAGGGAEGSDAPEAGADPADSQTPADNVSSDASSSQQGDSLSSVRHTLPGTGSPISVPNQKRTESERKFYGDGA